MLSIDNNFYAYALAILLCSFISFISKYFYKKLATSYRIQLFGKMLTRVKTGDKVVALTYDDGPNSPYTEKLLNVLKDVQVQATFFVIGQQLEGNLVTAQRMLAEGHELGNHSYSHTKLVNQKLSVIRSEITKTDEILKALGVNSNIHFRAPLGLKRIRLPWELACRNKTNILWDVDPQDYKEQPPNQIASFVVHNVKPGSIILLHDGGGNRSRTVTATKMIVEQLQAKGYQFKTISELITLKT